MNRWFLPVLGIVTVVYVAITVTDTDRRLDHLEHPTPAVTVVPQTSASPLPRATPTTASRSRRSPAGHGHPRANVGVQRNRTGSLLNVTCYASTGHRTASGKWPRVGMAASNTYPFGTRLQVETVGVVTVEDRIGWGSQLDLFGPSESFCRRFGRQHLHVRVLP